MFFSFPPFNCYLFAGKWKEFSWDQPGSCQQLELKSFCGEDVRAEPGGLCSTRRRFLLCGPLHHRQPGWVGLILLFDWDVDKHPWELWWEEHGPRAEGFLLDINGKQKMAREKFGKEGNFSVSSSLEKSILSHPSLPAEGGGFPNAAQAGFAGSGGRGDRKCPVISQGMEQSWATSCVSGGVPNLPPTGGQELSHLFPEASRGWDAPGAFTPE